MDGLNFATTAPQRLTIYYPQFLFAAPPASFVVRALEQSWQFADVSRKSPDIVPADPMAYVGGKYAAYINH